MSHARENRGLQIALMIFVSLTVLLGVTTFVFFRQYDEAARREVALAEKSQTSTAALRAKQDELNELKDLLGVPAAASLDEVRRQHAADVRACAANLPEECRSYRDVLLYQSRVIRENDAQRVLDKTEIRSLHERIATIEGRIEPQIARYRDSAAAALDELSRGQQQFRRTQEVLHDGSRQAHRHAEATRHEAAGQVAEAERRLEALRAEHREAQAQIEKLEEELRRLKQTEFTGPDGRIRQINYRLRTAWIDVGRADGLLPRLGFGVYPAAAWRLHDGNKKGQIEVTRVLGNYLSEAHVVKDVLTDPIIPGDQIQSAAWDPWRP